jgi:hypothetical protein
MIAKAVCRGVKGAFQSWSRRQTHLTSCVLLSLNVPVAVNCEALRSGKRSCPCKLGRNIGAVTGELCGNLPTI